MKYYQTEVKEKRLEKNEFIKVNENFEKPENTNSFILALVFIAEEESEKDS